MTRRQTHHTIVTADVAAGAAQMGSTDEQH